MKKKIIHYATIVSAIQTKEFYWFTTVILAIEIK